MQLHAVLRDGASSTTPPPTVFDLATSHLPNMEMKRLTLLLEVMVSRKIVKAEGHGAQRQWSLV